MKRLITRREFLGGIGELGLSAAMLSMFTGCTTASDLAEEEALTRGQWACLLAYTFGMTTYQDEVPYFSDIATDNKCHALYQSAHEWGVIEAYDDTASFYPDSLANLEFGLVTAVKAIGVDRIAKSTDPVTLTTDSEMVSYFLSKVASITNATEGKLYASDAYAILEAAPAYSAAIEHAEVYNVELAAGALYVSSDQIRVYADGTTLEVLSEISGLAVGSVLVLEPCSKYPQGLAAKITAIAEDGVTLSYVIAEIEEAYDSVQISGTNTATLISAIPATSGVTIDDVDISTIQMRQEDGTYIERLGYAFDKGNSSAQQLASYDLGAISFKIKLSDFFGDAYSGITISGSLSSLTLSYDIDYGVWKGLKSLDVGISATPKLSLAIGSDVGDKVTTTSSVSADVLVMLYSIGILSASLKMTAQLKISGEISLTISTTTWGECVYQSGNLRTSAGVTSPSLDLQVKAELALLMKPAVSLLLTAITVVDAGFSIGPKASVTYNVETPLCIDIDAYLYFAFYVSDASEKSLLSKLGLTYTKTFYSKSNSPIRWNGHYEIGTGFVDECTYGDESEEIEEEVDAADNLLDTIFPDVDWDGVEDVINSIYDYIAEELEKEQETTGFEDFSGYLVLSCMMTSLMEGEGDAVLVNLLPDGYSESDLIWSSSDTGVFTCDNAGGIAAVGEGVAMLTASTTDEKYTASCAVTVWKSYAVDFTPL